jgi:GT2 family glycosyltransferase
MEAQVTVIISPRDRYTGLDECVEILYRHTPQPFELWILDLDYPRDVIEPVRQRLAGRAGVRFFALGLKAPMDALRAVREELATRAVVLLDNDSRVTEGWLPPLLAALDDGHVVATPLILEREGVDDGAELRNHLYTGELRVVDVDGTPYLIEHKHLRRTEVPEIPNTRAATGTFELHCVLFDTATFRAIEIPSMVIREHLDIALQIAARGQTMVVEPASVIHFDNLGTRMRLADMRFFFFRWSPKLTGSSSRLFERRWGYKFYSEQSMYNWVVRRKAFLISRWLGLPTRLANKVTVIAKKLFCRDWDPLKDPDGASRPLLAGGVPPQRSHDVV